MKLVDIQIVRIYIKESSNLLDVIVKHLKEEAGIRGVSVFRAISGFGESHGQHVVSYIDLSLNLPLVIEFFDDDRDKIEKSINYLTTLVKAEHIVFWEGKTTVND